ncbi:transposase [Streptomyces sp. NPDC007983]|uniref:transposase n=1 Tax=Streptomyces sp. NPDC007983 TaxID=3364800 RepID=UPI0036E11AFD
MAALETGHTSWTAVLDAIRLQPGAHLAAVTTAQLREVAERLIAAGHWNKRDPEILLVLDSRYDAPRIAHLLAGLPVEILGRLRSDRVMRWPVPPRVYDPKGGRPLGLAGDRRPHPAPAHPSARHRPAAALGDSDQAEQAHPGPSPPEVPPCEDSIAGPCTTTAPARPRMPRRTR